MKKLIRKTTEANLPTKYGVFKVVCYEDCYKGQHLALVKGYVKGKKDILVRVHSECLTGDVFHSLRCDCGSQLEDALRRIEAEGLGVLLYLAQEGRGICLLNKLRAYKLQEEGLDTLDANLALGLPADAREYVAAADILRDLGITSVRLLSNNPDKRLQLTQHDIEVTEMVPLVVGVGTFNESYLDTKRDRMGHQLPGSLGSA